MTTANKITISRIAMLPLIIFFYLSGSIIFDPFFVQYGKLIAMILFVIAASTDWLDGHVARKYNLITNSGKLLDPIADKMLVYVGFILVATDIFIVGELIPLWLMVVAVVVALGRDVAVNTLRQLASEKGVTIGADQAGKVKSVLQFIAIPLMMFYSFNMVFLLVEFGMWWEMFEYLTIFMLIAATLTTTYSGANYLINYRHIFSDGDASAREKKTWADKVGDIEDEEVSEDVNEDEEGYEEIKKVEVEKKSRVSKK